MKRCVLTLFLYLLIIISVSGQEGLPEYPNWVYIRVGMYHYQNGEFGNALRYFREALEQQEVFPEAEYGIGLVFREEGEYNLARQQFERALANESHLYIPATRFEISYALAEIHQLTDSFVAYQRVLREIISYDTEYSAQERLRYREAVVNTALEDGLEQCITLYRHEADFALQAHFQLAVQLLRTDENEEAFTHLIFTSLTQFTRIIQEIKTVIPDYGFETIEDCLFHINRVPSLQGYLEGTNFYQTLFYLANAFFRFDKQAQAAELWRIIQDYGEGTIWSSRARAMLISPSTDLGY
ncbi:MAG: tetratricopeptide repeat protein [Spirochaetia bacterium]